MANATGSRFFLRVAGSAQYCAFRRSHSIAGRRMNSSPCHFPGNFQLAHRLILAPYFHALLSTALIALSLCARISNGA
jgi:hypothetical protein